MPRLHKVVHVPQGPEAPPDDPSETGKGVERLRSGQLQQWLPPSRPSASSSPQRSRYHHRKAIEEIVSVFIRVFCCFSLACSYQLLASGKKWAMSTKTPDTAHRALSSCFAWPQTDDMASSLSRTGSETDLTSVIQRPTIVSDLKGRVCVEPFALCLLLRHMIALDFFGAAVVQMCGVED